MTLPEALSLSALDREVLAHVVYRIANAQLNLFPYPHFYVSNVFPADFYASLVRRVSAEKDYHEEEGRYHGRQFGNDTMASHIDGLHGLQTKPFAKAVLARFTKQLEALYNRKSFAAYYDMRFIRDGRGYFIGPHTDAPWKLVSLLFYLPLYCMYDRYGTSIYLPTDPSFTCPGGPHYEFEGFTRAYTAPYLPNALFGFLKTPNAFHGVPLIDQDFQRDVLLYNLYDKEIYEQTHKPQSKTDMDEQPATPTPET